MTAATQQIQTSTGAHAPMPKGAPEAVRTPSEAVCCGVCGKPLALRQRRACCPAHRAQLHRQRQQITLAAKDRALAAELLDVALHLTRLAERLVGGRA